MQRKQSRSSRFVASATLCRLYQDKTPVKPLFDKTVNRYRLPARERNLAMQLIYGVLRHRQTLDRILTLLSRTPLNKIDPFVHQTLAVGLYQLFFLDRIPAAAAVNEAVATCKQAGLPMRLHGFVNGILRQAVRRHRELWQKADCDADNRLILNHPDWLIERWQKEFGCKETERICQANNSEPPLTLRANSSRIARDELLLFFHHAGISCQPGRYSEEALILSDFHGSVTNLPGYDDGFFQVQDEAAQLATSLLGPFRKNGLYLDGCAGLGGKTSHLLQFAASFNLQIHACEPDPYRLKKLRENTMRLFGGFGPIVHEGTLQQLNADALPAVDGILIDAPCSGTGVTGRHPDIRWNRIPGDLLRHQKQQLDLLNHAAKLLAPEGVLVYATCSLEPEENRMVVSEFLATHHHFVLTDCSTLLPKAAHRFITDNFFAPHPSSMIDGFFAARLQQT